MYNDFNFTNKVRPNIQKNKVLGHEKSLNIDCNDDFCTKMMNNVDFYKENKGKNEFLKSTPKYTGIKEDKNFDKGHHHFFEEYLEEINQNLFLYLCIDFRSLQKEYYHIDQFQVALKDFWGI